MGGGKADPTVDGSLKSGINSPVEVVGSSKNLPFFLRGGFSTNHPSWGGFLAGFLVAINSMTTFVGILPPMLAGSWRQLVKV